MVLLMTSQNHGRGYLRFCDENPGISTKKRDDGGRGVKYFAKCVTSCFDDPLHVIDNTSVTKMDKKQQLLMSEFL